MKKKFGIWLNIVTICLCICAIAIGVYAANTASLTVSGQVGFTAHGVELTIDGTLSGYVSLANKDTATATESKSLTQVKLNNNTGAMNLGEVYFTDLLGDIPPIVLTLTVTNTSNFKVKGTVDISALTTSTVSASCATTEVALDAKGGANASAEVVITFTLVSAEESITAVNLATLTASKPIMSFEKYTEPDYYIISDTNATFNGRLATKMGQYLSMDIEWIAYAVLGEGESYSKPSYIVGTSSYTQSDGDSSTTDQIWYTLNNVDMSTVDYAGKTFWFVSRYTLMQRNFDATTQIYQDSSIFSFLTGDGDTDFTKTITPSGGSLRLLDGDSKNGEITPRENTTEDKSQFSLSNFWLMSCGDCLSVGPTNNIENKNATQGDSYFLRTHSGDYGECVWSCDGYGMVWDGGDITGNYGVRPAFQLTIPA